MCFGDVQPRVLAVIPVQTTLQKASPACRCLNWFRVEGLGFRVTLEHWWLVVDMPWASAAELSKPLRLDFFQKSRKGLRQKHHAGAPHVAEAWRGCVNKSISSIAPIEHLEEPHG